MTTNGSCAVLGMSFTVVNAPHVSNTAPHHYTDRNASMSLQHRCRYSIDPADDTRLNPLVPQVAPPSHARSTPRSGVHDSTM